jgi:hypothetical protein
MLSAIPKTTVFDHEEEEEKRFLKDYQPWNPKRLNRIDSIGCTSDDFFPHQQAQKHPPQQMVMFSNFGGLPQNQSSTTYFGPIYGSKKYCKSACQLSFIRQFGGTRLLCDCRGEVDQHGRQFRLLENLSGSA